MRRISTTPSVLDHGFVRASTIWQTDEADLSGGPRRYGAWHEIGPKMTKPDRLPDAHWHSNPLEMCEIPSSLQTARLFRAPGIRHTDRNVNEYSARYSILDREILHPRNPAHLWNAQSVVN